MESNSQRRIHDLSESYGNTPLLAIEFKYKGELRKIYARPRIII